MYPGPRRWKEVSLTPHHSLGAEREGGRGQSHGVESGEGEENDREPRDRGRPVLEEPSVLVATWIYALVMDTCRLYLRGFPSCISIQCSPRLTMQTVLENYIVPRRGKEKKKKDKQQKEGRGRIVSLEKLFVKIFLNNNG